MSAKKVTATLSQSQAAWLMTLCAGAAKLPLHVTARKTNSAAYGAVVQGLADAMNGRRRRPAPAPTPLRRGPLYWDEAAGLFLREGADGPGASA